MIQWRILDDTCFYNTHQDIESSMNEWSWGVWRRPWSGRRGQRTGPPTDLCLRERESKAGQHTDNATSDNAGIETEEGVLANKWVNAIIVIIVFHEPIQIHNFCSLWLLPAYEWRHAYLQSSIINVKQEESYYYHKWQKYVESEMFNLHRPITHLLIFAAVATTQSGSWCPVARAWN